MKSPTKCSLDYLRKQGFGLVEVVERWNPFARIREDLFGFIDILAIRGNDLVAVQATSWTNVMARVKKISELESAKLFQGGISRYIEVHGWRKRKNRFELRVIEAWWDSSGAFQHRDYAQQAKQEIPHHD